MPEMKMDLQELLRTTNLGLFSSGGKHFKHELAHIMDATGNSNFIVKNQGDFSDGEKFYMKQLDSTQT